MAVADLADALDADLTQRGAARLLADLELPLTYVLADMEAIGIAADVEHLSDLQSELGTAVKNVAAEAHAAVGRPFNLGSPKQLQQILFDEMGLPKTKRTKTGYNHRRGRAGLVVRHHGRRAAGHVAPPS